MLTTAETLKDLAEQLCKALRVDEIELTEEGGIPLTFEVKDARELDIFLAQTIEVLGHELAPCGWQFRFRGDGQIRLVVPPGRPGEGRGRAASLDRPAGGA